MVGGGAVFAPRPGVERRPGGAGGDRGADDAGGVLAHVGQRGATGDVARAVEPVAEGEPGVVDGQRPARFEADGVETDVGGVRAAARRHQQLVDLDAFVAEVQHDRTAGAG